MNARRFVALFLPSLVVATVLCGLLYIVDQQALRTGANDPQEQLASDAASRIDGGASPASVAGGTTVDLAADLAPFVVVYDSQGRVLATDGQLDGGPPIIPSGVLASARATGRDAVTWQPRSGIRLATVTIPWRGGTVMAGRSLRLIEERVASLGLLVGLAWLATLVALVIASALAVRLWPKASSHSRA